MGFITKLAGAALGTAKIAVYQAEKHSPEILVGAGIALGVGAAVSACVATSKAGEVKAEVHQAIEDVHESKNEVKAAEYRENLAHAYFYAGTSYVKVYWKSLLMGTAAIAAILTGHNILRKRHLALIAAYSRLEKSYKALFDRVSEEFSETAASNFASGIHQEEREIDGKKQTVAIVDPDKLGPYQWLYCPECSTYYDEPTFDEQRLVAWESDANRLIYDKKKDFTLTVAELLADNRERNIPREFFACGWHMPWDWYATTAESYIKFDIRKVYKEYDGELKTCFIVDFNCDGYIWDKIPGKDEVLI